MSFGIELAVKGGHAFAHAPEQADLSLVSPAQMYSARPEAPVRYVPSEPFAVPIERVALDVDVGWLAGGEELVAGVLAL